MRRGHGGPSPAALRAVPPLRAWPWRLWQSWAATLPWGLALHPEGPPETSPPLGSCTTGGRAKSYREQPRSRLLSSWRLSTHSRREQIKPKASSEGTQEQSRAREELRARYPPERAMPHAILPPSSSAPTGSPPVIKSCSAARRKPRGVLHAAACVVWSRHAWDSRTWSPSPAKSAFEYPWSLGGLETLSASALTDALLP